MLQDSEPVDLSAGMKIQGDPQLSIQRRTDALAADVSVAARAHRLNSAPCDMVQMLPAAAALTSFRRPGVS